MDNYASVAVFKANLIHAVPKNLLPAFAEIYQKVDYTNYSPVKRLEEKVGINGVYKNYNIPLNMSPENFEALAKPMRLFEMFERGFEPKNDGEKEVVAKLKPFKPLALSLTKQMSADLIKLNPELAQIEIKHPNLVRSHIALISGVCSGFPVEDIKQFMEAAGNPALLVQMNNRKQEMSRKIEAISGQKGEPLFVNGQIVSYQGLIENWCPSEKTYQRILQKTQAKYKNTTRDDFNVNAYMDFLASRGFYDD